MMNIFPIESESRKSYYGMSCVDWLQFFIWWFRAFCYNVYVLINVYSKTKNKLFTRVVNGTRF